MLFIAHEAQRQDLSALVDVICLKKLNIESGVYQVVQILHTVSRSENKRVGKDRVVFRPNADTHYHAGFVDCERVAGSTGKEIAKGPKRAVGITKECMDTMSV